MLKKPYLIAEVGNNFERFEHCKYSIMEAKLAGASAIKFQYFTERDLNGSNSDNEKGIRPEWFPCLKAEASKLEIDFLCSVFNPLKVKFVDQFVPYHKIASYEAEHPQLLREINKTKKLTFISVGASEQWSLEKIPEYLDNFIPLYCSVNYRRPEIHLETIPWIRNVMKVNDVGFSDHTTDYSCIPVEAVLKYGAVVIEKHFNPFFVSSDDSDHSIDTEQFKMMANKISGKEMEFPAWNKREQELINLNKRRLISLTPINKGDKLIYGQNYEVYRGLNLRGSSPLPEIEGKEARSEYYTDHMILTDNHDY